MKDRIIRINSPRLVHPEQAADFEKEIVEDERAWTAQFDATTDEQWARMAEMARRDIAAGDLSLEGFLEQYAQRPVSPEEWNEVREQAWAEGLKDGTGEDK
jgi:hypothetical protein